MKNHESDELRRACHDLSYAIHDATIRPLDGEVDPLTEDLHTTAINVEVWVERGMSRKSGQRSRIAYGIAIAKLARMESLIIGASDLKMIEATTYRRLRDQIEKLKTRLWSLTGLKGRPWKAAR